MADQPRAADSAKDTKEQAGESKEAAVTTQPAGQAEDFPDPDEDDLDDLDAMLDDFAAVKVDSQAPVDNTPDKATAPPASQSKSPQAPEPLEPKANEELSEEDFAKQMEAGMADLLGELESSPDMQQQFENIFKSMSAAMGETDAQGKPSDPASGATAAAPPPPDAAGEASFQETIRRTMERMQASGEQATAAATSKTEEDFMSELLKQMSSGDFNAEGAEDDFSKMLMGMMEQLTNKDILYEPMKELYDKFPEWMEKNKAQTSAEDMKRYEEQQKLVTEIVGKFEDSSYSDSNPADREFVVDRMQKMQAAGSPPSDLVGDMSAAQDVFNAPDEQCNPQ